ncbi:hypothetical protein C8R45DRAFT_1114058 [Mycena sanguinolenta]|nr:hypothetical protein C8R45DRAFT_1114058 [Mycena sanguinolenta]
MSVVATNSFLVTDAQQHITSSLGTHVISHPSLPGARLFVKRRNPSLVDEAHTQAYLYQHARSSSSSAAPNMAEVYGTFHNGNGSTGEQERAQRSATAIAAIAETVGCVAVKLPPPGRSPVPLVDAVASEEHVNEALCRRPRRPTSLADEAFLFTHSHIALDMHNFLWDPSTPRRHIWLVDCQHNNVPSLPVSFSASTSTGLATPTRSYARTISPCPPSSPLRLS